MSDLISRSALIEAINKSTCNWAEHLWKQVVCDVIHNQPTAYDISKVVAELEKEKEIAEKEMEECIFKALPYHDSTEGKVIGIKKALEIVRKGGVE